MIPVPGDRLAIPAWQVAVLGGGVLLGAAMICRRRPPLAALRSSFAGLSLLAGAILAAAGALDVQLLARLTKEDNLVEWMSVWLLLGGAGVGAWAAARLYRQGRPAPLAATLATGCCWAFCREIEFGAGLAGRPVWSARNLLRPEAYLSTEYFERARAQMDHPFSAAALHALHVLGAAVGLAVAAFLAVLILRHRRIFGMEVRQMLRQPFGQFFVLGASAYLFAQVLGYSVDAVLRGDAMAEWRHGGWSHRLFDEPIETWGAMCLFFSMCFLWLRTHPHHPRRLVPLRFAAGPAPRPAAPSAD